MEELWRGSEAESERTRASDAHVSERGQEAGALGGPRMNDDANDASEADAGKH